MSSNSDFCGSNNFDQNCSKQISFWKVFIKFCWHVKNLQQWRQQLLPILPICQPMFIWILMAFIHIPLFLHPCVLSLLTFLLLLSRSMKSLLKDSRVKETHPPTTKALYMTEWEIRIHLQVPVYNIKVIMALGEM